MNEDHRLVQVSSHVTSFLGRVGIIGLCSCGWLGGEEGEDTRIAVRSFSEAWEGHRGGPTISTGSSLTPATASSSSTLQGVRDESVTAELDRTLMTVLGDT
jgi:hypothetical protein